MKELKALLLLGGPIILANIATVSMQLVDTILVGPLGAPALAGVGLGAAVISGVGYPLACLLLGLDSEIAKAVGARDDDKVKRLLAQMLLLCIAIGALQVLLIFLAVQCLDLFGVQPEIIPLAREYLMSTLWGMAFFNISFAGAKFLQARNQTTPAVLIAVVGNLLNGVLVYALTYGRLGAPQMGVAGAGLATAIARGVMAGCYLVAFAWDRQLTRLRIDIPIMRDLLTLGLPAAGQVFLEVGLFVSATFLMARFDAQWVAAHQIVLQTATLTFMFPMGLSVAAAVRIGLAIGAGDRPSAAHRGTVAWRTGAVIMAMFSVALLTVAPGLVELFNHDPLVQEHVIALFGFAAAFQLFDGVQVTLTGVLRGFGDTRSAFFANLVGHWVIALPVALLLGFSSPESLFGFGPPGIWGGLSVGLIAVSSILMWRWRAQLTREAMQGSSTG